MIHKTKEQSRWEEVVRSKLKDWEAETTPEDWEAIAKRLPGRKRISFFPLMRRYAAAVIALLLVSAGGYLYYGSRTDKPHVVVTSGGKTELTGNALTNPPASNHVAVTLPVRKNDSILPAPPVRKTPTVHNIPTGK
jgi:hypothetical protein